MGVQINRIINFIEEMAPLETAESYDNTGLILNAHNREIERIYLCLDITKRTVNEAISEQADLIISHHPILFDSIQSIDIKTESDTKLINLIKNEISVYSAHTNFDSAHNGLNYYLSKLIGLRITNEEITYGACKDKTYDNIHLNGRIGEIEKKSGKLYIEYVLKVLGGIRGRVVGNTEKSVKKIHISTGTYDPKFEELRKNSIDLIITGEVKYHDLLELRDMDILTLELGHFASEIIFIDYMKELLEKNIEDIIIVTSSEEDIYKYI